MLKKQVMLLVALVLIIPLLTVAFAKQAAAQEKEGRWEGKIIRSSKDHSTLTVRNEDSHVEKKVVYDSSTKWVSQFHADKKINDIDANDVKDQDYVICTGTWGKSGELHAALISKRLSHSE
jgi:hypothetical protein